MRKEIGYLFLKLVTCDSRTQLEYFIA